MRVDSYPLLDAFLCALCMYLATLFIFRLQGSDKFKNLSLPKHFLCMLPVWMLLTLAAVYNATEKSTKILGTIILVVGAVILYLGFFTNTFRSFAKSTELARMIQKYKGDYMNPQLVGEIYEYCCRHELLSPIVRKHNADIGIFALIYLTLLAKCPASAKGHFIPISTFFFAASLDYVLSKNALSDADALWLQRYFGLLD